MHFSRQSANPETARANLAAQLIYQNPAVGQKPPEMLPGNYKDPAWFAHQLQTIQAARTGRGDQSPLIILVDGLDEAPPAAVGQIAFGLPTVLPPGVVIVATTRPGQRLPTGAKVERIDVTGRANLDDLREHLTTRARTDRELAEHLAAKQINPETFARDLLAKAGGVWIYALSVIDQIRDGNLPADDLDTLPAGLAGYYSLNLHRIREADHGRWETTAMPVLGTLAAVTEPLTATTIAAWSGDLPVGPTLDVLDGPLRPFLAHTDSDDRASRTGWYRLRHQSLRDFLTGQVNDHDDHTIVQQSARCADETRHAHARIVHHLTPPPDHAGNPDWLAASIYAQNHLTEHAAASGELDRLAVDPSYLIWTPLPPLLRLRASVTDPDARKAIAARELTGDLTRLPTQDRLQQLSVWALKYRASRLADVCASRLDWSHPNAAAAIWGGANHTTLHGHTEWVQAACPWLLPDGRTVLATAGDDLVVRLWDPDTLTAAGELTGHTDPVQAACPWVLPDGRTVLATASDDAVVRLWDPDTLTPAGELTGHTGAVNAVCPWLMPDRKSVV